MNITIRESENIGDIIAARQQLEQESIRRGLGILEELHSRVMTDLARNPELEARALGRLRQELDADIRSYRRRLRGAVHEGQAAAFDLGQEGVERSLQRAGIRVGFMGISENLLTIAQDYSADQITDITEQMLGRVNTEIRLASMGGRTFPELVTSIGPDLGAGVFGKTQTRVEAVYRTEIGRIYNMSFHQSGRAAAERVPGTRKTWRHATGQLSVGNLPGMYEARPDHVALDGTTIPFDEDFNVGGFPAAHPLDARLPAKHTVFCGCSEELDFSEAEDETFRMF